MFENANVYICLYISVIKFKIYKSLIHKFNRQLIHFIFNKRLIRQSIKYDLETKMSNFDKLIDQTFCNMENNFTRDKICREKKKKRNVKVFVI